MNFKKIAIATMMTLALATQSLTPRNAEAGVIIGGSNIGHALGVFFGLGGLLTMAVTSGGVLCVSDGFYSSCSQTEYDPAGMKVGLGFLGLGGALFLLDAQTDQANPELVKGLKDRYSFIDSSEALNGLATVIQKNLTDASAERQILTDNLSVVSIPESDVREALASADLSAQDLETIVNDLK